MNRNKPKCLVTAAAVSVVVIFGGLLQPSVALAQEAVLEEIVVSARKRDESIRDVPASIAAFTGATIEQYGIRDIEDTYGTVPGLYFTGNPLSPNRDFRQLVIRGVGANSQLEPSVATIIDGVYSPALAFDLDFLDLERIEILKGPQGSLFGRNTEGGALNIVTRKPDEEFRARVSVEADEFNSYELAARVSGALSEENQVYGKLAVLYYQTDGYITNNAAVATPAASIINNVTPVPLSRAWTHNSVSRRNQDEGEKLAVSAGLRWVGKSTEIAFNADVSSFEGGDPAPGPLEDCNCYEVNGESLFDQESDNAGASLNIDWDTAAGTLTSTTGWRRLESSNPWDFDGTALTAGTPRVGNVHDFDMLQEIFSQELRLASDNDGAFNWLLGAYYFDETNESDRFYNFPNLDDPGGAAPQQFLDGLWNQQIVNIDRSGYAVFGQFTYNATDRLEFALGARYSDEDADVAALEAYCFPFVGFTGVAVDTFCSVDQGDWVDFQTPTNDSASWDNFSPSLSAKYNFGEDSMVYFSYAAGFKAGSYQKAPVAVSDVEPIDEEVIDSYEIGIKSTFLDGRLQIDAAIYRIDLEDMQLQAAVIRNGITVSAITNAGAAEVTGVDFSLTARPVDQLTLALNIGYADSEFTDYQIIPDGVTVIDRSGDSFPNTPETTVGASIDYVFTLSNDLDLSLFANYRSIDDTYVGTNSVSVDPIIAVPSWEQLDLQATLGTEKWTLTAFVDNATDEYIVLSKWNPFFIEPALVGTIHNRVAPPRRAGLRFTYNF
jgi:iron complex outermembrane receptor protein